MNDFMNNHPWFAWIMLISIQNEVLHNLDAVLDKNMYSLLYMANFRWRNNPNEYFNEEPRWL